MRQKTLLFVFAEDREDRRKSGWFSISRGDDGSIISFMVDQGQSLLPTPNEPFWLCDVGAEPIAEKGGNKVFPVILRQSFSRELFVLNFRSEKTGQHQSFVCEECDEGGNNRIYKVHADHNRRLEISGRSTWVCVIDFIAHKNLHGKSQALVVIPIAPNSYKRHQTSPSLA